MQRIISKETLEVFSDIKLKQNVNSVVGWTLLSHVVQNLNT